MRIYYLNLIVVFNVHYLSLQELESNVSDIVEEILTLHDTTKVCLPFPPINLLKCELVKKTM